MIRSFPILKAYLFLLLKWRVLSVLQDSSLGSTSRSHMSNDQLIEFPNGAILIMRIHLEDEISDILVNIVNEHLFASGVHHNEIGDINDLLLEEHDVLMLTLGYLDPLLLLF